MPNPFQFIIYGSYHWCLMFWNTTSVSNKVVEKLICQCYAILIWMECTLVKQNVTAHVICMLGMCTLFKFSGFIVYVANYSIRLISYIFMFYWLVYIQFLFIYIYIYIHTHITCNYFWTCGEWCKSNASYFFYQKLVVTVLMKFAYIMDTNFTKLRLFFHKVFLSFTWVAMCAGSDTLFCIWTISIM